LYATPCDQPLSTARRGFLGCVMMSAWGAGQGWMRDASPEGIPLMRAVLVSEFGGPEQLRLGQAADPVAGPGQVRVAVYAAGVNPVDAGNRADGRWAGLRVPCILGYDVAGVIDSVGPRVTGLAPGDRIMAMTHFPDGAGGYAELVVIDAARRWFPWVRNAPRCSAHWSARSGRSCTRRR
jgi:NADPH:quinone reductase-like Zn-dependent oxidoreductase